MKSGTASVALAGSGIALNKTTGGTVTLSGATANTYSGLTTVSAGTLILNKAPGVNAIVGDGVSSKVVDDILVNGGTLSWSASNQVDDSVRINVTSGTVNFGSADETLFDVDNSGGTVNYGTGNVNITDPTWSGGTNEIHGSTNFGVLNVSGGTNTVFGAAGPGGGPGTLTVNGGLNFSGTASPNITVNSDALTAGKIVLAGNVTSTVTAGTASITSGGSDTNPGQLDLNGATRTFTVSDGSAATDMSISAQIIGPAAGLTKAGAGTLALTGANTYSGTTTISTGTLQLGDGGTTGSLSTSSAIVNNANFAINRSNAVVQGTDFSGSAITGATGSLTQAGSGTTTLNAANTYGGGTTVNAGTLLVNNTTGSGTGTGSVTVNNSGSTLAGGTATGTGGISGAVTVNAGANIAPGNGAGTTAILSTGALTLAANSNFRVDINGTTLGSQYDQLNVTGGVTLAGNLVVTVGTALTDHPTFTIINNVSAGPVIGTFAGLAQGATFTSGDNTFQISYTGGDGNDVTLTATATPEPSTWIGGALAFAALAFSQRRRFARLLRKAS